VAALALVLLIAVVPSISRSAPTGYVQTNLVSDIPGLANVTDPNLVNAWGMAFSGSSFIWVSDNGTGVATLYTGGGAINPLVVTIPPPKGGAGPSTPTGQVFSGTSGFEVAPGFGAVFIFVTEDGTISGWNPMVGTAPPPSTQAILEVDRSTIGAIYKGVALNSAKDRLYAANFRYGTIEVFDSTWKLVDSITDPTVPRGFAPFNIQNLGGKLYVTFAKQDKDREDDVSGPGSGFVDVLDPTTNTFTRLISGQPGQVPLDSPWGLAIAPESFGEFSGALLVGNFGNGRIEAFDPNTGARLGRLRTPQGEAIKVDGLWALAFGISGNNGPPTA
jgi:uncharacterized protein (TIGR03118 family)